METAQTTFREQAEKFLLQIAGEARLNTLAGYRSILNARIIPLLGEENLANIDSATAKSLKDRLIEGGLSPATINLAVGLMKKIVGSATDSRGNRLYAPKWNNDFIRLPRINTRLQKAPIATTEALNKAVGTTSGEIKALVALLAGTGLRIGEALAIGVPGGNVWDSETGTIIVQATWARGQVQPNPKTEAGNRVVDLHPDLNAFLRSQFANLQGRMFTASIRTYGRQLSKLGVPGFHSMRRFRITHQQMQNVPTTVIKYAAGHGTTGDITERYTKVGSEIEARRRWTTEAGLGFQL